MGPSQLMPAAAQRLCSSPGHRCDGHPLAARGPPSNCDPVVILRASSAEELALASEVAELVRHRKGRVHELVGSRSEVRTDRLSEHRADLQNRDVYVSGPEEFVNRVVATVLRLGVPKDSVHFEVYSL